MSTAVSPKGIRWAVVKKKLAKRRIKACRYAVRAYGRQVWIGSSEGTAERLIGEYARLGVAARKVPVNR